MLPIAPTPTILSALRGKNAFSEFFLAMEIPNPVFKCRVNQTFDTHDRVAEITIDNITLGEIADVRPGMTVWVGTSEGAKDRGLARVRKAPTGTKLYIGEEAEIEFEDNLYLTVVDQFALWPKHIRINNRIPYMDWDIAYSNQHAQYDPVPVWGGPRVIWLAQNPAIQTHNDNYAGITYSGTWSYFDYGVYWNYGGNIHSTSTTGAYAEFQFSGSRIRWMSPRGDGYGYADVYIDGVLDETVDLYAPSFEAQQWVYTKEFGALGLHTIKIVCKGEGRDGVWNRTSISVDALSYYGIDTDVAVPFDASASWVYNSSIVSALWEAPGAKSISDDHALETDIVFDTAGQYVVYLTLTAANEKTFTSSRRIFVFDSGHLPLAAFTFESAKAGIEDGGWSFSVASKSTQAAQVGERDLCILFSRDYIDSAQTSYGPLEGHEILLAVGWVGKNSIEYDANQGTVSFDVYGPQYWLKQITAFPTGLELSPRASSAWTSMKGLTVDRGIWHLLHWRTTATQILDYVPLLPHTLYVKELSVASGTLWQQITTFAWETLFARLTFNRYCQAFLEVDGQLIPEAERDWDEWSLEKQDIRGGIRLGASNNGDTSMVNLSGVSIDLSGSASAYFSLSMGHVYTRLGRAEVVDKRLLLNQAQANSLAGLYMGYKNNPIPSVSLDVLRNNRFLDIAPRTYLSIEIEADDTPSGLEYDGRALIRRVEIRQDGNAVVSAVDLEAETFEQLSANGDIPDSPTDEDISFPPPPPPPDLPPLPIEGLPIEVIICDINYGMWYTLDFDSDSPTWMSCNFGLEDIDYAEINRMDVFPFTGRVYIAALTIEKIWTVELAGAPWQLVTDGQSIIDAAFSGFEEIVGWGFHFKAFGINKNASDQIALIAGLWSGPYANDTYFFIGDSAGVSQVGDLWQMKDGGDISYGNGNWIMTGNSNNYFWETMVYRFPNNGGAPEHTDLLPNTSASTPYHARAGTGDAIFHTSGDHATYITENGESIEDLELNDLAAHEQCVDMDPSGQIIMACKGGGGQISTDGGHTWTVMSELEDNNSYKFLNCHSDLIWICARNSVRVTLDGGVTWIDKTGNLADMFEDDGVNINLIRVLKYAEQE